jgi:hypothetical protein
MLNHGGIFHTLPQLTPFKEAWLARCERYQLWRAYYNGTVYDDKPELIKALKLYGGIRQIFGPLKRAVRIDVAKVPGEWAMTEETPQQIRDAVEQVRDWSHWRREYSRAVLFGAVAGEFGLLVVDEPEQQRVSVVPLRPDEVVTGTFEDGRPFGLIIKPGLRDKDGAYEYAQLITPDEITTYRDGALYDYGGGDTRPNAYGFVPLLLAQYAISESGRGDNAFAGTEELLDRVNDVASQTLDVIQRNSEPLTVFSGVSEIEFQASNNALILPEVNAKAYTLVPNLVIGEALELIREVKAEFKNCLPQLILDDMRSRNDLAYDTVLTLLMELTDHIADVRASVDMAFQTAERWALLIGNMLRLWNVDPELHEIDANRYIIKPTERLALGIEGARKALEQPQQQQQPGQRADDGADEETE